MTEKYQTILKAVDPGVTDSYEALIKSKDAELDLLFRNTAEMIAQPCEISEPVNDDIRSRLEALHEKEAALNNAMASLRSIYERLKDYESKVRQREAALLDGIRAIEEMGKNLGSLERDLSNWANNLGNDTKGMDTD